MTVEKRRGKEAAVNRAELIVAATALLVTEGIGAVSARRVAAKAGLNHQLVHYYFKSMDDLLISAIESGSSEAVNELRMLVYMDHPIRAAIEPNIKVLQVAMTLSLIIHACNRPALHEATRAAINRYRQALADVLARHLTATTAGRIPPLVAATLVTSVLQKLVLEDAIGMTLGHAETLSWLAGLLSMPELESIDWVPM